MSRVHEYCPNPVHNHDFESVDGIYLKPEELAHLITKAESVTRVEI